MKRWLPEPETTITAFKVLRGFAIAGAGGAAFQALDFPAPWIAGGSVAAAAASIARVEMPMPRRVRDVVFVLLGLSMGAGVTPETVERLPQWPITLVLVAASVLAITAGVYLYFRRVAGWDWRTALLAAIPGALSYVMAVAADSGADLRKVAIAQSLRIVFLVVVLPFLVVGFNAAPVVLPKAAVPSALDLVLLIAGGVAGAVAAERLKVPAGLMTGAFLASALLHGAGIVEANLPPWLLIPGFVGISVVVGARFAGTDLALLRAVAAVSLGGLVVASGIAFLCAAAAVLAVHISWGQAALTFAPGGLEAMTALAFALALDPAYVAAHQLFRFMGIALLFPAAYAAMVRWMDRER